MLENLSYDAAGKINLHSIYNNSDPTTYFSTLSRLGYRIPQDAKPRFQRLIEARRNTTETEASKVVDLGCSYGVNGALLKHGFSQDDLYRIYETAEADAPGDLLQQDRDRFADPADTALEMVGVDPADRAVSYAIDAGLLDAGVATNLEKGEPTAKDVEAIETADLVISTGCVGYVTEISLERLLEASLDSRPWMAHAAHVRHRRCGRNAESRKSSRDCFDSAALLPPRNSSTCSIIFVGWALTPLVRKRPAGISPNCMSLDRKRSRNRWRLARS
jgi:SAM-dependent methyltransferase